MKLISQIKTEIWKEFNSYKNTHNYVKKWHVHNDWDNFENFHIEYKDGNIALEETLHNIDGETLLKIAIDLGIETPDFIPSIPFITNDLKTSYSTAFKSFENAMKKCKDDPDLAIGLANSTLESIIKHIIKNDNIKSKLNYKDTLYDLMQSILKEFNIFPHAKMPQEIKIIGSGFLNISKQIESLRSEKTTVHGKLKEDYIIDDPLYAHFILNSVATIGLFLISFYEKKYNNRSLMSDNNDLPF